jgi:predicted porin
LEKLEMKKTLVALAALATVGAAFAQSSVTLYGKIDWEVVSKRATTAAGVNSNAGLQVNSGGLSGSRWGMKGTEDLGGGMTAIFDLQSGIDGTTGQSGQCGGINVTSVNACIAAGAATAATGATGVSAPRLFGRQAFAGVKGGFGQLTVGRQYAPYDNAFGQVDGQGYTANSAMGSVWAAGGHADAGGPGRVDNQITYFIPATAGFNAQLSWAPGEDAAPGISAGRYFGIGLGYGNGPLNIQFATESMKSRSVANAVAAALGTPGAVTGVGTGGVGTTDAWIIGASYDLKVAKPYFAYGHASNAINTKDKSWSLGATAPLGPVTVSAGYARETSTLTGAVASASSRGFGGQAVYNLSKRTNVYGEFMALRTTAAGATASGKSSQYGVGMRHDF